MGLYRFWISFFIRESLEIWVELAKQQAVRQSIESHEFWLCKWETLSDFQQQMQKWLQRNTASTKLLIFLEWSDVLMDRMWALRIQCHILLSSLMKTQINSPHYSLELFSTPQMNCTDSFFSFSNSTHSYQAFKVNYPSHLGTCSFTHSPYQYFERYSSTKHIPGYLDLSSYFESLSFKNLLANIHLNSLPFQAQLPS